MKWRKIDMKLISELMKNSKRSDRELAKLLAVSQPTISRRRATLEKRGYIKEYSIVPDWQKLGFELMAFTFAKFKRPLDVQDQAKVREAAREIETKYRHAALLVMTGMGMGFDRLVVSFHENYESFLRFIRMTRGLPFLDLIEVDHFLVSLKNEDHYMPLGFSAIANYLVGRRRDTVAEQP